jgi:hypothetical protein
VATNLGLKVVKKNAKGKVLRKPKQVHLTLKRRATAGTPTGTVRIVATGTLKKNGKSVKRVRTVKVRLGKSTAKLPRGLKPGRWKVKATFAGDPGHRSSKSKTVTFRIKK